MGLKTLLRNWLGVAELETALAAAEKRVIDQQTMRKEIADALLVVFSGERTRQHYGLWFEYFEEDHGGRFERTLRKVTGEQAESAACALVNARIGGEAFIDELVARVRRKQLDA
jgi:hypothetical protein